MLRVALICYMVLTALVGTGPRCLFCTITDIATTTQFGRSFEESPVSPACHCCQQNESESEPVLPTNPEHPSCPCQNQYPLPMALIGSATDADPAAQPSLTAASAFALAALRVAPQRCMDLPVACGSESPSFPFLQGRDILCALSISRC